MNTTPPGEQRLLEAVIRVERMGADIGEIKNSIKEMASAITRLAIFEERQAHDRLEIARVIRGLDVHDARIVTLELAQPLQRQTTDWVGKAVWLVLGAVIMAVLAVVVVSRGPDVVSRTSTKTTTEVQK
jgi:hypothetical protein